MHLIISITLAAFITQVFSGNGYSTKYDNHCGRGIVPEALETSCAKCSDKQKKLVRKFIKIIRKRKPEDWRELRQKYDPTGKFTKSFEQLLTA